MIFKTHRRVRLIVHVIDISQQEGRDAVEDYQIIERAFRIFRKLAKLSEIIVLNKSDINNSEKISKILQQKYQRMYI